MSISGLSLAATVMSLSYSIIAPRLTDPAQEGETSLLSEELQSPLGKLHLSICQARPHLPNEEDLIIRLHRLHGNRWSLIAGMIHGRYKLWTRKDLPVMQYDVTFSLFFLCAEIPVSHTHTTTSIAELLLRVRDERDLPEECT
ncbi:transcription factor MYB3 [Tanacetum coccineum]